MTFRPSEPDDERIGSSNQSHDAATGHFGAGNVPGTVSGHGKKGGPYAKPHSPGVTQHGGAGGGAGAGGDQGSGESEGGTARPTGKGNTTSPASPAEAWLSASQAEINQAAASGNPGKWAATIEALDAAITAAKPLAADQVVYREFAGAEKLEAGSILTSKGFMATSPTPLSATASKITIPAGSHALSLSGEVLLPRGTHLRVDGLRQFTVVPEPSQGSRQLAYYRVLWMRSTEARERAEILEAARRIQGGRLRP